MHTLRFRIAVVYTTLVVLAMAALGLVLLRGESQRFREALDDRLQAEAWLVAEAVAPVLQADGSVAAVDPVAKRLGAEGGVRVTIIAPDGRVLGDSDTDPIRLDNHGTRPEVLAALSSGVGRATRRSDTESRTSSYIAVPIEVPAGSGTEGLLGVARVSTPESAVGRDLRRIGLSVAVAAALTALAAAALAVLLAGAVARPLDGLRRAAAALAGGSFNQRVEGGGGVEVQELATAFNEMASRLQSTLEELAREHSRLESLLAASGDALLALDRDGVVRYANPASEALFGASVGRRFREVARNHELSGLVRAALASGKRERGTVHLVVGGLMASPSRTAGAGGPENRAGGSDLPANAGSAMRQARDLWLQATVSPIVGGGEWAVLLILQDTTEVRRAETTRRDFVANVSHELRTPLAGIKAVVETLRDGAVDDPEAAAEFLGRVDEEVDRLVQLVEELLHLSRIESGAAPMELAEVSPHDLLERSAERFRHQAERAGVEITVEGADLQPMRADPERLAQAVGNLVHNAIKFTPPGGRVTLSAEQVDGMIQLLITDTGSGIDPADLPRIFERFYVADRARSRRGTGLGLAIVKHVVRAHGGTVEVESALGKGSTFTIEIPTAAQSQVGAHGVRPADGG